MIFSKAYNEASKIGATGIYRMGNLKRYIQVPNLLEVDDFEDSNSIFSKLEVDLHYFRTEDKIKTKILPSYTDLLADDWTILTL